MQNKKIISEALYSASASGINSLIKFFITILLAQKLPNETFGMWATLTAIAAIFMTGDFGVGNALRNKISYLIQKEGINGDEQRQYFYITFYCFIVISTLFTIALFLFQNYLELENLFKTENQELKAQGNVLAIIVIAVYIANLPLSIQNSIYYSYNESFIISNINLAISAISLSVLSLLIFTKNDSILNLIVGQFGAQVFLNILSLIYFIYRRGWIKLYKVEFKTALEKLNEIFRNGIMFMANDLTASFLLNSPTIFVASIVDLKVAATYNLAQKIFSFFALILQNGINPIWSHLSLLKNSNNHKQILKYCQNTTVIIIICFAPIILFVSININWIFNIISNGKHDADRVLVALIGLTFLAYAVYDIFSLIHKSFGKLKGRLFLQLTALLATSYLVKLAYKEFGIQGIPAAFAITWTLMAILIYYHGKKIVYKEANLS